MRFPFSSARLMLNVLLLELVGQGAGGGVQVEVHEDHSHRHRTILCRATENRLQLNDLTVALAPLRCAPTRATRANEGRTGADRQSGRRFDHVGKNSTCRHSADSLVGPCSVPNIGLRKIRKAWLPVACTRKSTGRMAPIGHARPCVQGAISGTPGC